MPYKFEISRDRRKKYRFRFVAPNGKIMMNGEGYERRKNCLDSIESIQRNAPGAKIVDVQ